MLLKPKLLECETIFTGYLSIERFKVKLADGERAWREVERSGGAAVLRKTELLSRASFTPMIRTRGIGEQPVYTQTDVERIARCGQAILSARTLWNGARSYKIGTSLRPSGRRGHVVAVTGQM